MNNIILLFTAVFSVNSLVAQVKYSQFPYTENKFINKVNISWAAGLTSEHSFSSSRKKNIDVYSYLQSAQRNGLLKAYVTNNENHEGDFYVEADSAYIKQIDSMSTDTTNLIRFQEIFYLENTRLKSLVTAAAPLYKLMTSSGVCVSYFPFAYSSLNVYGNRNVKKWDDIVFLGETITKVNFESIESVSPLKKTYGMSLSLNIWYDLSKGKNQLKDLKKGLPIASSDLFEYSPFDSVGISECGDSLPMKIVNYPGPPAYDYFSDTEIIQEWYYNKTKNIFFNKIPKIYLYIKYYDHKLEMYKNEKWFEVTFTE